MSHQRELGAFSCLLLGTSGALWAADWWADLPLLPADLPASAAMALLPAACAMVVLRSTHLARRAFDLRRAPRPLLLLAVAVWPATLTLAGPVHAAPPAVTGVQAVGLGVAVGLGALTEELGWQGFVWPRLHLRPLPAAAALGVAWAAWHVVPYVHMGHDASWIAWHCAVTVCVRVVLVWFFLRARRSVAVAALFHASCNLAYFLHPWGYEPARTFPVAVALCLLLVASDPTRWRRSDAGARGGAPVRSTA